MTTPPRVDNVNIKVTYKGDNVLEMDVGIATNVSYDVRKRMNEAVANLIRLMMEASQ